MITFPGSRLSGTEECTPIAVVDNGIDDALNTENFFLDLTLGTNSAIGNPGRATVNIIDIRKFSKIGLTYCFTNEDGSVICIALSDIHAFLPSDLICSFSRDAYDVDEGDTVQLMVTLQGQPSSVNVDKFINCQGVTATGEYKLTPREIDFCVIYLATRCEVSARLPGEKL